MKQNHIMSLMQTNMTTVSVRFIGDAKVDLLQLNPESDKLLTYKVKITDEIQPGDFVVVMPRGCFKVAQVVTVHDTPEIDTESDITYKWIVQKIDMTQYKEMEAREAEFLNVMKKPSVKRLKLKSWSHLKLH